MAKITSRNQGNTPRIPGLAGWRGNTSDENILFDLHLSRGLVSRLTGDTMRSAMAISIFDDSKSRKRGSCCVLSWLFEIWMAGVVRNS